MSKNRPTVLVLGASGLFGSKICTLLQRLAAQSSSSTSSSSSLSSFRIAVASRTPAAAADLAKRLESDRTAAASNVVDFTSVPSPVDVSQQESLRAALQQLQPVVVVNATGAHKHVEIVAVECVRNGSSLVDISEDVDTIDRLEEVVAQMNRHLQQQPEAKSSNLLLCATGISTSPCMTSAAVNQLLDDIEEDMKNEPEEKQKQIRDKEVSVEIGLFPGMGALSASCPGSGGNYTAGAATMEAIISRVGNRYSLWRNGREEYTSGDDVAFRTKFWTHLPPPVGTRLVSPFPSPDVKIGGSTFLRQEKLDHEKAAADRFRQRHDPTRGRVVDESYGKDFVTTRSIDVSNEKEQIREVAFVAGLEYPLVHRLVAWMPIFIRDWIIGHPSSKALLGLVFRAGSFVGGNNGALTVRVLQHSDEMSRESDQSRHRSDELTPATSRTMLISARNGAGVFLPALPAAVLVLKLLQLNGSSLSSPNSGSGGVAFYNGALRREWHIGSVPFPHPAVAALRFPELERAIGQAFPSSSSSQQQQHQQQQQKNPIVRIEKSCCLFEYVIGHSEWKKVHPVVRAFHEASQATSWCEDSLFRSGVGTDRRDRRYAKFNALVYSPKPERLLDSALLLAARLPHDYPKWTQFSIETICDPFIETWTRRYPRPLNYDIVMLTTLKASSRCVKDAATGEMVEEKCMTEALLGGFVELVHTFTVDAEDGSLFYNVVGASAFWGWMKLPMFLVPKAKAKESCCKKTGKFRFQVSATLPIVGTKVQYRGTVRT